MDPVVIAAIGLAVFFLVNMPVGFAIIMATLLYFDTQHSLEVGLSSQRMISGASPFPCCGALFLMAAP